MLREETTVRTYFGKRVPSMDIVEVARGTTSAEVTGLASHM